MALPLERFKDRRHVVLDSLRGIDNPGSLGRGLKISRFASTVSHGQSCSTGVYAKLYRWPTTPRATK
jgi:hypothetical protein